MTDIEPAPNTTTDTTTDTDASKTPVEVEVTESRDETPTRVEDEEKDKDVEITTPELDTDGQANSSNSISPDIDIEFSIVVNDNDLKEEEGADEDEVLPEMKNAGEGSGSGSGNSGSTSNQQGASSSITTPKSAIKHLQVDTASSSTPPTLNTPPVSPLLSGSSPKRRGKKGKKEKEQKGPIQHYDSVRISEDDSHTYRLMYDMLLGIRLTVGQMSAQKARETVRDDFLATVKWKVPKIGSATTPAHSDYDFKFKDYAPLVFRHLRERFGIDAADYLVSLTGDYALTALQTPGKSGSFFYFSVDQRFIIKTMSRSEAKFLRQILPHYYQHVMENTNTLLAKFFGLHRVKPYKGRKIHFVVMGNIYVPDMPINIRYDLKGSTVGRRASSNERAKANPTFKDLDLRRNIVFGPEKRQMFFKQLKADTKFLEHLKIMDYSLLLGVHFLNGVAPGSSDKEVRRRPGRTHSIVIHQRPANELAFERTRSMSLAMNSTPLTARALAQAHKEKKMSKFSSEHGGIMASGAHDESYPEIYYCGIIDILQPYNTRKQLEHTFKSIWMDKHGISAVSPSEYAKRFVDFLSDHCGLPLIGTEAKGYTGPSAEMSQSMKEIIEKEKEREREKLQSQERKERIGSKTSDYGSGGGGGGGGSVEITVQDVDGKGKGEGVGGSQSQVKFDESKNRAQSPPVVHEEKEKEEKEKEEKEEEREGGSGV